MLGLGITAVVILYLLFTNSEDGSVIRQVYEDPKPAGKTATAEKADAAGDVYSNEKTSALTVVEKYFSEIQKQNYEGVMGLYHDRWFENMTNLETVNFLKNMDEQVGTMGTYALDSWETKRYFEENGGRGGLYATFIFTSKRSKFDAKEIVTLFKADDEKDYLIMSHNIDSEAFKK